MIYHPHHYMIFLWKGVLSVEPVMHTASVSVSLFGFHFPPFLHIDANGESAMQLFLFNVYYIHVPILLFYFFFCLQIFRYIARKPMRRSQREQTVLYFAHGWAGRRGNTWPRWTFATRTVTFNFAGQVYLYNSVQSGHHSCWVNIPAAHTKCGSMRIDKLFLFFSKHL